MIPTSGNDKNRPESSGKITISDRKVPEIDGKRKNRNLAGRHQKNPKNFRLGILLP